MILKGFCLERAFLSKLEGRLRQFGLERRLERRLWKALKGTFSFETFTRSPIR